MTIERAIEAQRLRLLRHVAALLTAVAFVSSVRPCFLAVPRWLHEGVWSILSRAEAAAEYLVIAQARLIAVRTGSDVDPERLLDYRARNGAGIENAGSLSELRERLVSLLARLDALPRFGLRLLRQTEKRVRRLLRAVRRHQTVPCHDTPEALCALRLAGARIERPPDKLKLQSLL